MGNTSGGGSSCQLKAPGALGVMQSLPVVGGLFGGHSSNTKASFNSFANETAESFTSIKSKCLTKAAVQQNLTIGDTSGYDTGDIFEENAGCIQATDIISKLGKIRHDMVMRSYHMGSRQKVHDLSLPADLQTQVSAHVWTEYACKKSVVKDINQDQGIQIKTGCQFENSDSVQLAQAMQTKTEQATTNQKDVFGQLGGMLSGGSQNCISTDLKTNIETKFNADFLNEQATELRFWQGVNVAPNSGSVWIDGLSEGLTSNTVATIFAKNKIQDKLYQSAQITDAQNLIDKNDTIGDVANALSQTLVGSADLMASSMGKLLLITGVVAFIALILIAALAYFSPDTYNKSIGARIGATV